MEVEDALRKAALWDEVKDNLSDSWLNLSGGQQQRLSIARSIAVHPEVLLLDEPCSAIDPMSSAKIERTIAELKRDHTIIIVTHNLQQAASVRLCRIYVSGRTNRIWHSARPFLLVCRFPHPAIHCRSVWLRSGGNPVCCLPRWPSIKGPARYPRRLRRKWLCSCWRTSASWSATIPNRCLARKRLQALLHRDPSLATCPTLSGLGRNQRPHLRMNQIFTR